MLTRYLAAAMRRAHYELIDEDQLFFASIPGFDGLWSSGATLEECRDDLAEALEGWVILGLRLRHKMPELDGMDLDESEVA